MSRNRAANAAPQQVEMTSSDDSSVEVDSDDEASTQRKTNRPKASRRSGNSQQTPTGGSTTNDMSQMVADCVQYILVGHQKHLPVKRQDISANSLNKKHNAFKEVIDEAKQIFSDIYGFLLLEVPDMHSSQTYILVSKHSIENGVELFGLSDEEKQQRGILITVLAVIFMTGHPVTDVWMNSFLESVGLDMESKDPVEGLKVTIKELMTTTWTRQLYLKLTKERIGDVTTNKYSWGFRAESEIKKHDMLKFVSDVLHCNPKTWRMQYSEAEKQSPLIEDL